MRYGYACLNTSLTDVRTNRSMVKATFESKGLAYASELALQNIRDLVRIISWNNSEGIDFYRMSSDIFPWMSEYEISDLPDYDTIKKLLAGAGQIAKKSNQRLSFHPGHFCILTSKDENVVDNAIKELNQHGEIMDLMGLDRSPFNKINTHVYTAYGDHEATTERFAENFRSLDEGVRARLTVENDDRDTGYDIAQLYDYIWPKIRVPLVFDVLHHHCNPPEHPHDSSISLGIERTMRTWPAGITPVIHVSSSRPVYEGAGRPNQHADYIYEKVETYGMDLDVMFEAKMKDRALLRYMKEFGG